MFNQRCISQGRVEVTFVWTPSRQGSQWFDVSRVPNFSGWANQGPFAANANFAVWTLESNTTYFARVSTFTAQGLRISDTLQLRTAVCPGAFSAPGDVDADVFDDFVRVSWDRGNGNFFYCVDTAFSQPDLVNFRGSWRNWGCGTTGTSLDLRNLACERVHFYRVWAAGNGVSGYSEIDTFVSQECDFSPPTNPRTSVLSDNTIRFRWDRGSDNHFFCIDLALSQGDLTSFSGTWSNAGCGTTGTVADVSGLQCGTQYFYRIWAAGTSTSGYTSIATVMTPACDFEPPEDLVADVQGDSHVIFTWDEQDPALWFCVDAATSQSDLLNFEGSWRNFDCGGTDEMAEVMNDFFDCGDTYFWRVYAFAGAVANYSEVDEFLMDC